MKVKNLEIGLPVQVKAKNHTGFFEDSAGKFGTIVAIDECSHLDVKIKYEGGGHEWGNRKGIKQFKGTPLQDLKVGDRVEILDKRLTAFFDSNKGRTGTVVKLDPDCTLDVRVEFAEGAVDWGNHKDVRVVTAPSTIKVGTRVRLLEDHMFGFVAGDVGTVKHVDSATATVHFDLARNGWESQEYGIPDLHGLYVNPEDLKVITD